MKPSSTPDAFSVRALAGRVAPLGAASVAVKPLWLAFVTVACARGLGPEGYGVFSTALAVATIASSFTSWGIQTFTVREVSLSTIKASYLLSNFILLRIILFVISGLIAIFISIILGYKSTLTLSVIFGCLFMFANAITIYAHAFFQSFQVLGYQAASIVAEKVLVIFFGGIALLVVSSAAGVLAGMALGAALTALGTLRVVTRQLAPIDLKLVQGRFFRQTLPSLAPLGLIAALSAVFYRVDTIMVEHSLGVTSAGYYGLAFRLVEALNLLLVVLVDAGTYPRLASLAGNGDEGGIWTLFRSTATLLVVSSVPIAACVSMLAAPIIGIAGSAELAPAIPVLALLAWAFPLTSIRHLLWSTMIAKGDDVFTMWSLGGGVGLNITLNAVLLPALGLEGAVIATLVSEGGLLLVFGVRLVHLRRRVLQPSTP